MASGFNLSLIFKISGGYLDTITMRQAGDYIDKQVKIHAWVTNKRSSGKIAFLQLRDGHSTSKVSC